MIEEVLKRSENLKKFFVFFLVFWLIFILANIFTVICWADDIAIIVSAISFWVTIMIILFISSIVRTIKFYLYLEDFEDERFTRPERSILKQLKVLAIFVAGLDMIIFGVGFLSVIPKFLFISKTKEFKKIISEKTINY